MHFGRTIKAFRILRNLSPADLGNKCRPRMSERQIRYVEDQEAIKTDKLVRLAKGLDVSMDLVMEVTENFAPTKGRKK